MPRAEPMRNWPPTRAATCMPAMTCGADPVLKRHLNAATKNTQMHFQIRHHSVYRYSQAVRLGPQLLRFHPRGIET